MRIITLSDWLSSVYLHAGASATNVIEHREKKEGNTSDPLIRPLLQLINRPAGHLQMNQVKFFLTAPWESFELQP